MKKTAYLGGGCFWGLEELFRDQPGVIETIAGYCGGTNDNPTYDFHPGHAECIAISYDDQKTTYQDLLDYFFRIHDPTTPNQQGNDRGSSYRSVIFYSNQEELKLAQLMIKEVDQSGLYKDKVITNLEKLKKFYPAEDYHQDYLRKHPGGYTCHYLRTDKPISHNYK